jgi:hypothetical protein
MPKDIRQLRKGFITKAVMGEKEINLDAVTSIVNGFTEAQNDIQLDAITLNDKSFDKLIAETIMLAHTSAGVLPTVDSIDSSLMAVSKTLDNLNIDLDSATPEARGIVAQIVGLNIYSVINASLPFSGKVSDFVGDKNTGKFKLYSVEGIVVGGAGDLDKDSDLLGANAGKKFAFLNREEEQLFVAGTTDYTFNLKAKATDATNYLMERGKNSVTIGAVFVDDYDTETKAKKATRNVEVEGVDTTVEFDYTAGTIKVKFASDITADTPINFEGVLDTSELDKIVGSVNVDILDQNYIAIPIAIDVKAGAFDIREALQTAGINIKATGLKFALDKVEGEKAVAEINKLRAIAVPFGEVVDIKNANENDTIADRYKNFVKAVELAKADILEKSTVTGNIGVVGGKAVIDIVASLGTTKVDIERLREGNAQNGLRKLDSFYGVEYYYDPTHDEKYPKDAEGNETVIVGGIADNELKKPILVGVGLPLLPEEPINEISGSKTTRLLGSLVVAPNKDPKARNQVRKIKVKL